MDLISFLDSKGEDFDLEVEELEELHSLSKNLFSLSKINTSKHGQQSRMT